MLIVILNCAGGSASEPDVERRIVDLFRAEGSEIRVMSSNPETIDSTIAEALRAKPDAVVAAGGDGTVSSVAAAVAGGETPLGILPLGTLNHFAKDLRIPTDLAQAVATIASRQIVRVDAARLNGRVFVNNSSLGIYPSIVKRREMLRRQGHRKWAAFVLATAHILARSEEVSVRLNVDGKVMATRTPFVFVGNNEYEVTGIHLGGRQRLDGGKLAAYLAPRMKTRELPGLLVRALVGRPGPREGFQVFSAAEIWIDTLDNRRVSVATDGEVARMATPLHYQIAPAALKVFAPS